MTSAQDVAQASSLLELPPELQNILFEQLLASRRPIQIKQGRTEPHHRALLDVCRELRTNASQFYYHTNTFTHLCMEIDTTGSLASTDSLITWLKRIDASNRASLREIRVRFSTGFEGLAKNYGKGPTKGDLLRYLQDQNARILREVGWMSLSVLRVLHICPRCGSHWLNQLELEEMRVAETKVKEATDVLNGYHHRRKGPGLWDSKFHFRSRHKVYSSTRDPGYIPGFEWYNFRMQNWSKGWW